MIISAYSVYNYVQNSGPQEQRKKYENLLANSLCHHFLKRRCCSARSTLILMKWVFASTVSLFVLNHSNKCFLPHNVQVGFGFPTMCLQSTRKLFIPLHQLFLKEDLVPYSLNINVFLLLIFNFYEVALLIAEKEATEQIWHRIFIMIDWEQCGPHFMETMGIISGCGNYVRKQSSEKRK